jgi:NMD protein affecting ribosome stability and mRNA decay
LDDGELKQLRATLDDMLENMEPDPMFFVTKEGPVTGGWDLQLGSKAMAKNWGRRLVRSFGGTIKETSTVVGSNDGIDVTRLTLSYRKPAYGIRDVIRFRKQLWLVDGWQKDGPSLRSMDRFERTGVTWRDMEKSTVVCPLAEQHLVEVMNRDSSAAEVMDPNDYRMVTVALPYDDDKQSSRLRIGFIDGAWLALPGAAGE